MTASLYQSGSAGCASGAGGAAASSCSSSSGMDSLVYKENVRGERVRVEFDVVFVPLPHIAPAPQPVLHLELRAAEVELDPARLHIAGVEVHHGKHEVVAVLLRLRDQLVVVDLVEFQAPVRLQRPVFFPDGIELLQKRAERIGTIG